MEKGENLEELAWNPIGKDSTVSVLASSSPNASVELHVQSQ